MTYTGSKISRLQIILEPEVKEKIVALAKKKQVTVTDLILSEIDQFAKDSKKQTD